MYVDETHCLKCDKVTTHHNGKCCVCAGKIARKKEAAYQALSLEEKVELLRKRVAYLEERGGMDV